MWVFTQFFKKVHSTKPAASRNESAEIFVVCLGYKSPDKIDPRFLDPKHVFSEVDGAATAEEAEAASNLELVNPEKKKKKPAAEGYETGATVLFKSIKASEFVMGDKAIHILNNYHEIALDESRIRKHPKTTDEIVECCKDIKVLGMKELRLLKRWREALRTDFLKEAKNKKDKEGTEKKEEEETDKQGSGEDSEDEELKELDEQVANMRDEERRAAKRAKKKSSKEKRKTAQKIDLKMIIPGDEGPVREEEGLFRMKELRGMRDVEAVTEKDPELLAESESDDDDEMDGGLSKTETYSKEKGRIDKSGLFYKESDSEDEGSDEEEDEETGDLGLQENGNGVYLEEEEEEEEEEEHLLTDLDHSSKESKKRRKADMWFEKDVFKNIEDDDELAEEDISEAIKAYKKKNVNILSEKGEDAEESSDDEDDENEDDDEKEDNYRGMKRKESKQKDGFEVVPKNAAAKKRSKVKLTPEELAIGQEMIMSKKRKRDLTDAGWNRYMHNDKDEDLPDWFVKEEQMHMRPRVQPDPKVVEEYKQRQKALNVKTIKKVVEAKARKKRRAAKKMEKAKKKAAVLMENPDMGSREKQREIQRMYKKAAATQKKETTYVVAKKHTASKRAKRPAGVKGFYKQVDPRMKKDTQRKRGNATSKRVRKRTLKGKKTKPTRS